MKNQDSIDWKKYEAITKYIYETLGQEYNIKIEGFGSSCTVRGYSGVTHQIDVLTSETDDTGTFRTAIECKYWNKKVTKDTVMKLIGIINDTNIQRGIIVSKSGYTPDAQQYAKHHNILIVQLREAGKEDKELKKELQIGDLQINIRMNIRRPMLINIYAVDLEDNTIALQEQDQYKIFIEDINRKRSNLFDGIMRFKRYLQEQEPYVTITKEYPYLQSLLYFNNDVKNIKSITYTGLLTVQDKNQLKVFSIVDRVWLVMKKIFEQQTFVISEGGLIVHTK